MPMRLIAVLVSLTLTACAAITRPPDTALLMPGAFGTLDNDVGAANMASWAFASPARIANDPVDAALACAAIDYLAGELASNPRWVTVSALTKQYMLQARPDVRRVLGIRPDAPSQIVVDTLLRFAVAWRAGDQQMAMHWLATPVFTQPPAQTLQILTNLPAIPSANIASLELPNEMLPGGDLARR